MGGAQLDLEHLLLLRRQIGGDDLLRAAQHERTDTTAQLVEPTTTVFTALLVLGDLALLDRLDVPIAELPGGGEEAGSGELEQRPQVGQAVLHRGACDRVGHIGTECGDRPMQLRLRVLHELGLVEDEPRPLDRRELLLIESRHRVGAHDDIDPGGGIRERSAACSARGVDERHAQLGREPCSLGLPGAEHRGGREHEERPSLSRVARVLHEGEQLQRLAESHVVGQDPAEPVLPEERQPVESGLLVGTQLGAERRRHAGGRNAGRLPQTLGGRAPAHGRSCASSARSSNSSQRSV